MTETIEPASPLRRQVLEGVGQEAPYRLALTSHDSYAVIDGVSDGSNEVIERLSHVSDEKPRVFVDWCRQRVPVTSNEDVTPVFDALHVFASRGQAVRRIGSGKVRGVPTVHYHVLDVPGGSLDVWIDDQSRVRRSVARGDKTTITVERYDFDVPDNITIPKASKPCPNLLGLP